MENKSRPANELRELRMSVVVNRLASAPLVSSLAGSARE